MALLRARWHLESLAATGCPALLREKDERLIVCGTSTGEVVGIDGDGKERWRTPAGNAVATWPTIDEMPEVGLSILLGTEQGRIICLAPTGEERWNAELDAPLSPFNNVAVVRGAPRVVLVATDRAGQVTGLDGNGAAVWRFHTHHRGVGPAAVGDIDGDGADEIIFTAGDGHTYCLAGDGALRWNVRCGRDSEYSAPVLAEFGDGPCVLAGSTDDHVRCIGPDGRVRWTARGVGAGFIECGLALGDVNGDGSDELVFVHQGGGVQAVDGRGGLVWSTKEFVGGDQPFAPSLGDINGDGAPEILLAQRKGAKMRVLTHRGALIEEHEVPGGMFGAPVIADVDGDGRLEVLTVSMQTGALSCHETASPASAESVVWPTSRGNFDGRANRLVARDGAKRRPHREPGNETLRRTSPDMVRLGTNAITFSPAAWDDGLVEIALTGPDGIVRRAVTDGAERPFAKFELLIPGDYRAEATLLERATYRPRGRTKETLCVGPFTVEREAAARLLDQLKRTASKAPELADDIERVRRMRSALWMEVVARMSTYAALTAPERRRIIDEVNEALGELRREVACQQVRAGVAEKLGRPVEFLPWLPDHPWAAFDPATDVPTGDLCEALAVTTDQRGHEASVVEIANVYPQPLVVRAWLDPLLDGEGAKCNVSEHLVLRQVTWVPVPAGDREETASERRGADALPDLGEAGLIRLDGSSSGRLWIDFSADDLPAGTYSTTLHLRALTAEGATWDIPITWTVSGLALPQDMPLHFCNWGYVHASQLKEIADAALEDMQDHYTSVFVTGGTYAPKVRYDADGNIVGEIDWTMQDWLLERMRPRNILLFPHSPLSPVSGAPGIWSEAWKRAFTTFLPRWVGYLRGKGFGYERWAFYPVDEPGLMGGSLIVELERFARFVKSIDPHVQIYTDPYRGFTVADYERCIDVLDILQPAYHVVTSENTDRIDYLKGVEKTKWIYEAQAGVKSMVPPTEYYWGEIWTAWEVGFTGIGYWTYCTTGHDMWSVNADYVMVYGGMSKPVPSVRWQAIRIGIEDYARLWMLREAIAEARSSGRIEEADRAEKRLHEIVREAHRKRWDPALVASFRRELVERILALR